LLLVVVQEIQLEALTSLRISLALLMLCSATATASGAERPGLGTLTLVHENDILVRDDEGYTSGSALLWVPGTTPDWASRFAHLFPWIPDEGRVRVAFAVGQSIFTPRDLSEADPPDDDRPYAGWLYGALGLGIETGRRLDQLALTMGVVGPASGAEQAQKLLHEITGSQRPRGWDTQLENEPGLVLAYQRSWRELAATRLAGIEMDWTPHLGATLGNVYTYANTGLTMRLGQRLPLDFGPPRAQPGLPNQGFFTPSDGFAWYLYAGLEGRAVAYNVFLDGNTFRDSRSVDKDPLVGDLQSGLVLAWSRVRLTLAYVLRSREFDTQRETTQFGSATVSVAF
jgi:lipid A 3-O-deacylase